MFVCDTKDNLLRESLLRECDLTLSKEASVGHTAEETRKHARDILRSQPTAKIDKIFEKKLSKNTHNTRNQNTRDFVIVHNPEANAQLMENFVMFVIKITISKLAIDVLVIKYMKLKNNKSDETSNQSDY